jgi:4'-phosphopantetheinyl transferase
LAGLRQPEDQQRFLVGRAVLRLLAGACLHTPPESVPFHFGPFGKPFVVRQPGDASLQFNVSHSGKLVLLAFHPCHEVGVDVEEVRGEPAAAAGPGGASPLPPIGSARAPLDWESIARDTFPSGEYQRLMLLNTEARLPAFYRAWTRHEARLKALGLGIAAKSQPSPDSRLQMLDLDLPPEYRGAVCVNLGS